MYNLIMSYSLAEIALYNRENNTSIKGSWLYELAKKYNPVDTDNHIKLIGFDELNRVEIQVSLPLFDQLRKDNLFIQRAINLRRLRTIKLSNRTLIEYLCYPISEFDNDLDNPTFFEFAMQNKKQALAAIKAAQQL